MYEGYPFIFPGSLEQNVAINDLPNLSTCSDSDERISSSIKNHSTGKKQDSISNDNVPNFNLIFIVRNFNCIFL